MNEQVRLLTEIDDKIKELSAFFINTCAKSFPTISSFYEYGNRVKRKYGFEFQYEHGLFGLERKSFQVNNLSVGVGAHHSRPLFLNEGEERTFIGEISGYDGTPKPLEGFPYERIHRTFIEIANTIMNDRQLIQEIQDEWLVQKNKNKKSKLTSALKALEHF